MQIAETIHLKGLKSFKNQTNILNLVIQKFSNFIARSKVENFSYRFIVESLLFISNIPEYLSVFCPNEWKYGPEKTPYLDTFRAVQTI